MAIISRTLVWINGKLLRHVMGADVQRASAGREVVQGMTPDGKPIGIKDGAQGPASITIKAQRVTPPELNWFEMWRDGVEFTCRIKEHPGGADEVFSGCKITDISTSADESQKYDLDITVVGPFYGLNTPGY